MCKILSILSMKKKKQQQQQQQKFGYNCIKYGHGVLVQMFLITSYFAYFFQSLALISYYIAFYLE